MRILLVSSAVTTFAVFGLALRFLFVSPQRVPVRMRILGAIGTISAIAHVYCVWAMPSDKLSAAIGLGLYTGALLLIVWTWRTIRSEGFGIAYAGIRPKRICCDGPYRWIRHPAYVSYTLAWIAGAVTTGSALLAISVAVFVAFYLDAAVKEEREIMATENAEEYGQYRSRVRAFVPFQT